MRLSFADFDLDTTTFELCRGGVPVPMEPQVFDVLAYLVRHRDRVVQKAELLWYLTGMGPFYGNFAAANGYADEVAALRAVNKKPMPWKLVWPRAADPLLSQVAVFGDIATVHTGLAAWDDLVDIVAVCVAPAPAESVLAQVAAGAP